MTSRPTRPRINRTLMKTVVSQREVAIACLFVILVLALPAHMPAAERTSDLKIPPEMINRTLKERDPSLMTSVKSVLDSAKQKNDVVLIDVRNQEEFERARIPRSINIPLFAIKTKVFLKAKPLVLLNEGYSYGPLERACRHLTASGFRVSILSGGLNHWRQKGGRLKGDPFAQKELNKMPPGIFFEERQYEGWVAIDVSESQGSDSRYLIPEAIHVPWSDNTREFVSKLKAAIARHESKSLPSVLIFNEAGARYERIENLLKEAELNNVFFLEGGLRGYKTFLQRQTLIWQANHQSKKTLKECANCP